MPHPRDRSHARIYKHWLELPAWQTLTCQARALIVELLARYLPESPNHFELSDRTVAGLLSCARPTAAQALRDLEDRGWISVVRVGRIYGPKARRASVYALTYYPAEPGEPASKAFLNWKPGPDQQHKSEPSTVNIRAVNGSFQQLYGKNAETPDAA